MTFKLTSKEVDMLIAITGIDGCGKGTQIELLRRFLDNKNLDVRISKAYGEIEKESLSHFFRYWSDMSITLAFQAIHREQHLDARRHLAKGRIVLADRWDESYIAYHKNFGELAKRPDLLRELHNLAFNGTIPDITFLLRVSLSVAKQRTEARGADFFDSKDQSYHYTMAMEYEKLAEERKWIILNGEEKPQEIHQKVLLKVQEELKI